MSIRMSVALDEDVVAALQEASKERRASFQATLNEAVRVGLLQGRKPPPRFRVKPLEMGGPLPGLNYECFAEMEAMDDEKRVMKWCPLEE